MLWLSSASANDKEEAQLHFQNGVELITAEKPNYVDAYYQFRLAYDKSGKSWKVLGNLGLCAMKLERDAEAIQYYKLYLEQGADQIAPEEIAAIRRESLLLEGNLAAVELTSDTPGLQIIDSRKGSAAPAQVYEMQGAQLKLGLRAGEHLLTARHGDQSLEWRVVLRPKTLEVHAFEFNAPPAATPTQPEPATASGDVTMDQPAPADGLSGMRIGAIAGWVVGAVGIGGGVFFLLDSSSKQSDSDDLFAACNPQGCTADERDRISSLDSDSAGAKTLSAISFGVGAAAAVTGTVLWFMDDTSADGASSQGVRPWVGYRSAGVSGTF